MTSPIPIASTRPDAGDVILEMKPLLMNVNGALAGSIMAAHAYDKPQSWGDVDVFVFNLFELAVTVESLLAQGWQLSTEKDEKAWHRWRRFGAPSHYRTTTVHLTNGQWDVNVTFKNYEGHAVNTPAQVIESFDFGLLGMCINLRTGSYLDYRATYFADEPDWTRLPMFEERATRWSKGLIVAYTGIRQAGRYHKYQHVYGYDLSQVKPVLVQGYEIAAEYNLAHFDEGKQKLGVIYTLLGEAVAQDDWAKLSQADTAAPMHEELDEFLTRID